MTTNRDATADLATCDTTGDTEWAYEFYSEALPWWIKEAEKLRGVAEANLAMSADLIAMEGAIKELRHELDRSRNAHGKAELKVARLRKIIDDATGHSKDGDGVDLLCKALYGRPGQVPDWLGGSEARMLYDAVKEIGNLNVALNEANDTIERMSRDEVNALDRLRAELADLQSREVVEHGGIYYAPLAITNGTWEWFDASEGVCAYVGGESIPRELYVALPGVNLEKFAMAYPTREAAMQALRDAIETVKKEEEQP